LPGALVAVVLGVGIYWICHWIRLKFNVPLVPNQEPATLTLHLWHPGNLLALYRHDGGWWGEVLWQALMFLPVMLPFALATIVGGIDCTESAAAAGDEYDTRTILLTEGLSSILAGLLGGVLQTTPYIGQPAYKKMGGRALYTLATALFIGAAGYFGWFTVFFAFLPKAAMFPILVFVGLEITAQSYHATPGKHYAALAFATLPALAYLIKVPLEMVLPKEPAAPPPYTLEMIQTLRCLANGFIVTSLLWGAALAMILDGKMIRASLYFAVAGLFALFGVIHSPLKDAQIWWPGEVLAIVTKTPYAKAVECQTPYHWAAAYGCVAALLLLLGLLRRGQSDEQEPIPASEPVVHA
jgi:AGZA family xanthine/uracil permease-like MFS transporter